MVCHKNSWHHLPCLQLGKWTKLKDFIKNTTTSPNSTGSSADRWTKQNTSHYRTTVLIHIHLVRFTTSNTSRTFKKIHSNNCRQLEKKHIPTRPATSGNNMRNGPKPSQYTPCMLHIDSFPKSRGALVGPFHWGGRSARWGIPCAARFFRKA